MTTKESVRFWVLYFGAMVLFFIPIGWAAMSPTEVQAQETYVHMRTSFAPVDLVEGGYTYVNPAEVVRMDDGADPGGPTQLTLTSGGTLLVLGNVQQVGRILRVDVWVEERQPSSVER